MFLFVDLVLHSGLFFCEACLHARNGDMFEKFPFKACREYYAEACRVLLVRMALNTSKKQMLRSTLACLQNLHATLLANITLNLSLSRSKYQ